MNENTPAAGDLFEKYYAGWVEYVIKRGEGFASSFTRDFTDDESYRKMVDLGTPALPGIMAKLQDGDFLMNRAAFEITGLHLADIVPDSTQFYSEQEVGAFLLRWWDAHQEETPAADA